jgi:hypothetical protein
LHERDTTEISPVARFELNAERIQDVQSLWHHALTAWLIDSGSRAVSHYDAKAFLPRGNCGSQTGRTASHDEHIRTLL